jgi:tripartite-type tricarboxylate transporter receptor subunit TctC
LAQPARWKALAEGRILNLTLAIQCTGQAAREDAMKIGNWAGVFGLCLLTFPVAPVAHAQADDYPNKTVTIISDAPPGSTPDVDARFVAEGLSKAFDRQFIIINHQGANGSVAARIATDAIPDGYTLFMPALSTFVALHSIAPNLPLMLPRDFIPIGYTAENPMFVAVNPKLDVATLPQFIALAKKEPGKISIAVTGAGRLTDLTGLLLEDRAGLQLLRVPYNGGPAAALADVGSGRVSMIIEGYSGIVGAVKAGQVKLIAVASPKRLPQFPDLPTVAETIPGFHAQGWQVLVAPKGTPTAIVGKVSDVLAKVVSDDGFKASLAKIGSYSRAMTPEQTLAFVRQEQETWAPMLQKASKE